MGSNRQFNFDNRAYTIIKKKVDQSSLFCLVLRADAYRFIDKLPPALDDIEVALAPSPDFLKALLERSITRRHMGDYNGARTDWLILTRFHSSTRVADAARRNIKKLEIKIP